MSVSHPGGLREAAAPRSVPLGGPRIAWLLQTCSPKLQVGHRNSMRPPHFLPLILRLPVPGSVPRLLPLPCRDRESRTAWRAAQTSPVLSRADVPRAVPGTVQPHTSSPSRRPKMPGPQQALCLAGPGLASADQCPRRVTSEMLGAAGGGRDRVLQSWRSAGLRHRNTSHTQVPCVRLRPQRLPGPGLRRRAGTRAGAGDRLRAANGMRKAVG